MSQEIKSKSEPQEETRSSGADPEDQLLNNTTKLMAGFSETQTFIRQVEQWSIDQDLPEEILDALAAVSESGADFFHRLGGLAGQLSWKARQ